MTISSVSRESGLTKFDFWPGGGGSAGKFHISPGMPPGPVGRGIAGVVAAMVSCVAGSATVASHLSLYPVTTEIAPNVDFGDRRMHLHTSALPRDNCSAHWQGVQSLVPIVVLCAVIPVGKSCTWHPFKLNAYADTANSCNSGAAVGPLSLHVSHLPRSCAPRAIPMPLRIYFPIGP